MNRFCLLLGLSLLASAAVAEDQRVFMVIVHPDNPNQALERQQLSALFLRETRHWPDGLDASAVDLSVTMAVRDHFSRSVHGMPIDGIQSHWRRQIFSGRATPPPVKPLEQAIAHVRETPGGVAYIPWGEVPSGVKRLEIRDEGPSR